MALLLETTLGDLVIDLDIEGSPELCKNVLKLAKARYFTSNLIYNVQPNRFCQLGDPQGDGSGGACIYGLISTLLKSSEDGDALLLDNRKVLQSPQRFLKSNMGRALSKQECQEKGRVVATEMKGIPDTIGSQLLITTSAGQDMALDGYRTRAGSRSGGGGGGDNNDVEEQLYRSVGVVVEDDNHVLDQIAASYCDADGRPYADIRVIRALVIDDPYDDPPGMDQLMRALGVVFAEGSHDKVIGSPTYERPPIETVEMRIQADQVDPLAGEEDIEMLREQEEKLLQREDKSRAVVLEMLGDLPDADIKAPENVLFVCKLNPVTEDEDLELIFSRFDEQVKAEIIRDPDTGNSLQYAFVEFTKKEQAVEAYFKMNNALVDDRRIKVDFSQSVAKVWNKFSQRAKNASGKRLNQHMPKNPFADGSHKRGTRPPKNRPVPNRPTTRGPGGNGGRPHRDHFRDSSRGGPSRNVNNGGHYVEREGLDPFGRSRQWGGQTDYHRGNHHSDTGRDLPRYPQEHPAARNDQGTKSRHHRSEEGSNAERADKQRSRNRHGSHNDRDERGHRTRRHDSDEDERSEVSGHRRDRDRRKRHAKPEDHKSRSRRHDSEDDDDDGKGGSSHRRSGDRRHTSSSHKSSKKSHKHHKRRRDDSSDDSHHRERSHRRRDKSEQERGSRHTDERHADRKRERYHHHNDVESRKDRSRKERRRDDSDDSRRGGHERKHSR